MPTTTIGLFFIGKDYPGRDACSTHKADDGQFILKMRVLDNQGPRAVEAYVVRWIGADAQAWWAENGPLKSGAALSLELVNPRSFPGPRTPEIHAEIARCRLMPARQQTSAAAA